MASMTFGGLAHAQQAVTRASLAGTVEDRSGGGLAGATVTARSVERGQSWSAATDAAGRYRFLALPADTYEVRVEHAAFRSVARRLTLTVGQEIEMRFRLEVAGGNETVEVAAEAPIVETVRTQVADTIVGRDIDGLPLNGRNYLDLAALTPAVTRSNPVSNQRFPETGAVPGTGLSVTGQRQINNTFVVD